MEVIEIVKKNLCDMGENYDLLKPFMQKWLIKVETAIQARRETQVSAESTLRTIDYSVKSIAEDIEASRTTLYNHQQLLKRYILQSVSDAKSTNPFHMIAKCREEKALLQKQISLMMERDVDVELLKMHNHTLSTALEGKNAEIGRLEARIAALSEENAQLKAGQPSKVVPIAFRKD